MWRKPLSILLRCYRLTEHTYNFSLLLIVNIYEFQADLSLILREKVVEGTIRRIEMMNSKRTAQLPSSFDFDRLVSRDDEVCRDHLFQKYEMLLKNTDLLVDIIRQLTDINDKDRGIIEKLENASYRRFAFRQIKRHVIVCLNDLMQVTAMIDEDFMTSRLQRMGEMIKKVMDSWDIMLHGIEVIHRNPKICTTLPKEIELFYELSSIDMEEFDISLGLLKDELASRMSFCQLSSIEEFNVCITYSLGEFKLDQLRFDKLSLVGDCERSNSEEDAKSKTENKTLKRKHKEDTNNEENELEIKSNAKRMRSCESENSKDMPAVIRPKIILDSSCDDTFPYDYDPSEGCVIGKSISREDFISKHKYITAWAECQSETCLNRNSANSASSFSGEDMDLDEISVEGKFSDEVSETNFVATESQLPSRDLEVSADLGHLTSAQIHSEKPSTEFEPLSNIVYSDCLKSHISDHVKQPTQPTSSEVNNGLIETQKESKSNLDSDLKCYDKVSSKSDTSIVDSNNNTRVLQGCNDEPKIEACRASTEILPERESNTLSGEANSNICLKTAQQQGKSNLTSELKCYDKVSSKSDIDNVDSNDIARVKQGCKDEPKAEACRISNEISPERNNIKLSGEAIERKCLKITLVHKGCGIWAVKTSNKRKRSESESDNCTDSMNDAQAILEESAKQRCKVLKRVKLALTNDHSSKKMKQGPAHTTKFKSLRRLATNLCEMKSRIFRRPFQKKRATVTPLFI